MGPALQVPSYLMQVLMVFDSHADNVIGVVGHKVDSKRREGVVPQAAGLTRATAAESVGRATLLTGRASEPVVRVRDR